jgi:RimJ/RimL family protein N-acetyltransferase
VAAAPALRGPRVVLRQLVEADAADLLRAAQDPEVRRLTGTKRQFTMADTVSWCRSRVAAGARYDWAVTAAADGGWLGDAALMDVDPDNGVASFRIALERRPGEGLGTEATGLVLGFAFGGLGLYRVELEVFDFNTRAQKAYGKCGFEVEGIKRGGLRWAGERYDVVMMAAINPVQRARPT